MTKKKSFESVKDELPDSDAEYSAVEYSAVEYSDDRPDPADAGQSGDTQGLSGNDDEASESVRELLEEGQAWEAGIVSGIENAPNADEGPIKTHEVPEDDVPSEYIEKDPGDQR